MARRLIIGVVGHTGESTEKLATLAAQVGLQITEREVILLTGGEPKAVKPVKDAAMYGAESHGSKKGRLISILPRQGRAAATIHQRDKSTHLRIDTLLSSHERNVINGRSADVVIALQGGPGTLSEIAFANDAQTPLVFLDSLLQLRQRFDSEKQKLMEIIEDARKKYSWIDVQATLRRMSDLLHQPEADLNLASNPKAAVDKALTLAINSSNEPQFPAIPPFTISQAEFDTKVGQL